MTRSRVVLGLLGLVLHAWAAAHEGHQQVLRAADAWPIDPFTLTDQHQQPFTQASLAGRWTFVLFGDTACGSPCTGALAALDGVLQRIARAEVHKVTQVLFVSQDSKRDRPERLREYMAPFDKRFVAAVGTLATVSHLADEWRVGKDGPRPRYSGSLLLVGPDGAVRAEYLPPFDVPHLTADFLKTRARKDKP